MNHMFDYKTVLVTGATGLIGSNLVGRLLEETGAKVIALGRNQEKLEKVFEKHRSNPQLSCVAQDICRPITTTEGIDVIFHAAGPISGAVISAQPVDVILPNIIGIKNCLDFMKDQYTKRGTKGRVVVFSSATVYANNTGSDRVVSERDTGCGSEIDAPNAPYADSKRMAEILTKAYCRQYGVDAVIVRIGYVYGYCRSLPDTAFYSFLKSALAGEDIIINNPSMARRDNIYIDDVVSGLLAVYEKGICGEAYNISSAGEKGNFAAADEMACIIADVVNKKKLSEKAARVVYPSEMGIRQPGIILCNEKLKRFGWKPEHSLYDGIMQTIDSYLEGK